MSIALKKNKIAVKNSKHILVLGMVFLSFTFFYTPKKALAGAWGEPMAAALMQHQMGIIARSIEGVLLGSLKMAAVQMLNNQVGQLIGGGAGGQPRFITNFNDFLFQGPQQRADLYMNDFFTLTTRGRGSAANYIGAGSADGIGGNYAGYLESIGRQATTEKSRGTMNLEEYTASPQAMFEEGDFRALNAFFSNPYNNPYGYALEAEDAYQGELMRQQQAAAVEATSSGFLGAKQGDTVVAPAGSIEAATTNIQNLPNQIIAAASNPTELLSGVVSATANKVVTGLVNKGIGQVQANIQREISGVNNEVNAALRDAASTLGPAAPFAKNVLQQSVRVNSSTPTLPGVIGSRLPTY